MPPGSVRRRTDIVYSRILVTLSAVFGAAQAHAVDWQWPAPEWAALAFEQAGVGLGADGAESRYVIAAHVNPSILFGDFDGDHRTDVAVLVRDSQSSKIGIAIARQEGAVELLGAGKSFGNGGDDFSWLDHWYTFTRGPVEPGAVETPPPVLAGDALYVEKSESASGLIYYTGSGFAWYQQGD